MYPIMAKHDRNLPCLRPELPLLHPCNAHSVYVKPTVCRIAGFDTQA